MTNQLDRAAKVLAMVAISKARRTSRAEARNRIHITLLKDKLMSRAADQAQPLAANLYRQLALSDGGRPLPNDTLEEHEAGLTAPAEWVRIGATRLIISDADPTALALATGAIDQVEQPTLCLRVKLDVVPDQPQPRMGDIITIDAGEGVTLTFMVQWTHTDSIAPIPKEFLGATKPEDWQRDTLTLGRDEVLLVQVVDIEGLEGAVA